MKLSLFQKGLLVVVALTIFFGSILFVTHILNGDAFTKEEAQHAVYSLWLFKDLRGFDLGAFGYDTQRQMYWPFLHSWVQSAFFLLFGPSIISARSLSLLLYAITLILIYAVATRFCDRHGRKVGMLSVVLALTSPMMIRYATENTLEGLGALVFMLSFYYYTICEERKLFYEYLILGFLIGLSIYTNYLYAYLMIPAFMVVTGIKLGPLVVEGVHLQKEGEKTAIPFLWWAYKKLIILAVLMTFIAAWFLTASFSRKIMLFLQAIFRYSGGEEVYGLWNGLLYYPRIIIENYAFSPWLGLLIVIAIFKPFVATNYRQLKKIYTLIWTILVLVALTVPTKAPQFIYIVAPFLFIVFSAAVFYWTERYPKLRTIIFLCIFLPTLFSLPRLWREYFPPKQPENMVMVLNYFRQQVLPRSPIAAAFGQQRLSPEGVFFHFWDWNAPVLSDPAIGEAEMFRYARYMFSVELEGKAPYQMEQIDESSRGWNTYLQEKAKLGELREVSSRRFGVLGLTAKVYEKVAR